MYKEYPKFYSHEILDYGRKSRTDDPLLSVEEVSLSLVFNSLDMSRSVSVTTAGQCRLAPLIQVILDCSHLYDYAVKLLFKLHSCEYSALDLWKLLAARPSLERGSSPRPGALGFLLLFQKARGAPSCLDNKRSGPSLAVRRDAPSLP